MKLNQIFQNELDSIFRHRADIENFDKGISKLTRSEHKNAQKLRARALHRALRRTQPNQASS